MLLHTNIFKKEGSVKTPLVTALELDNVSTKRKLTNHSFFAETRLISDVVTDYDYMANRRVSN